MGTFSNNAIAVANRLIDTYGSTITVKEPSSTSYVNGDVVTVAGTETNYLAHVQAYESERIGGLIKEGDIEILTKNNIVYTKDTKIIFKGTIYSIINLAPLYAQDDIIIYSIQVRV